MPRAIVRRRGGVIRARGGRRKADVARRTFQTSTLGLTAQSDNVFSQYQTDAGLLAHPPGITVVGIRYTLSFFLTTPAAISPNTFYWGFIVTDGGTPASVIDPAANEHLDWMEYGNKTMASGQGAQSLLVPLGQGDDGFRTVRSRRRLNELSDILAFAVVAGSSGPFTVNMQCSVHFLLP